MKLDVKTSLGEFNAVLGDYAVLARMLPADVLAKKGTQLGFELYDRLTVLKPAKGAVTAQRLALLSSKASGVRVRPELRRKLQDKLGLANIIADRGRKRPRSVYGKSLRTEFKRKGKRLNFQALAVKAELSAREGGRGYSAHVARISNRSQLAAAVSNQKSILHRGRYNQLLASVGFRENQDSASLDYVFGSSQTQAGNALQTPKAQEETADAIRFVTEDTLEYITDKLGRGKL